ncbi:hypothetical protein BX600DRAFT_539028 [Xylariales sp. PMI_506]|nr:hypothetical protein BX600DRAFT_539028 [Xylariales sp. PMI_506]
MHRTFLPLALFGAALASCSSSYGTHPPVNPECLQPEDVKYLTTGYEGLVGTYNPDDADRLLTADFWGNSESINAVAGFPLDQATFPSLDAFKQIQTVSPSVPLEVTDVDVVLCDFIALRYNITFGTPPETVLGQSMIWAEKSGSGGKWQIKVLRTEFNNLTYLKNLGGDYTLPPH